MDRNEAPAFLRNNRPDHLPVGGKWPQMKQAEEALYSAQSTAIRSRPPGEIEDLSQHLQDEIRLLRDVASELIEALGPVLLPETPVNEASTPYSPPGTVVGTLLRSCSNDIRFLRERLQDVLSRVAL